MKPQRGDLSTADLARTGDDMRGRVDEEAINRAHPDDRPGAVPADRPGADRPVASPVAVSAETHRPSVDEGLAGTDEPRVMLFPGDEPEALRRRWNDIQVTFVDAPRQAVERADALVAEVMKRMAEIFADERASLERQWDRGDDVTTEDLRVTLRRYRAFFDRLLTM